jgi:hypothetical protein
LLIIAAIGLAILLTALALALNTAVYAEIHVSETDNSLHEHQEAIQYEESVRRAVAGMIAADTGSIFTETHLRTNITTWSNLTDPEYARDSVATNASVVDVTAENRIVQNETRTFEDQSNASNWTVASNASAVDGFDAEIQEEHLVETTDCDSADECFTLTVEDDDGDTWQMFVYSSTGNQTVEIDVEPAGGNNSHCEAEASSAAVNVTDGVFVEEDGSACTFDTFTEDDQLEPPYTVRYHRAGDVSGTYNLTVTGEIIEGSIGDDNRYGTTGSPRIEPRIVAANVSISYRSPDLTYRSQIRVVPGDTDG